MAIQNARERILISAIKIFAEKSFDGSRIDDIAAEAKVPKSLIYYHFKSKDEILEVLTSKFIDEFIGLSADHMNESHQEKSAKLADRMKDIYYEFGRRNADLVRVIFFDSLKKNKSPTVLFRLIETMVQREKMMVSGENYDVNERLIAEFFTSFIPNCAYILFADEWTRYFKIDKSSFDMQYMKVYQETHGSYHKNHKD